MLDKTTFNELTLPAKIVYLYRHGTWLATRNGKSLIIKLFYLHDFYVEAYYSVPSDRYVLVTTFDDTGMLTPYLADIHLNLDILS